MNMRVFIFGAGYSARAFARRLSGQAEFVGGTTRSPDGFGKLEGAGITPFVFHGDSPVSAGIEQALQDTTHLVVSAGPDNAGDPVLRQAGKLIAGAMPALRWIGYLSTVGVYGDHGGAWVDEDSECRPLPGRSASRIEVEQAWQRQAAEAGIPVATLRLSGIYGPGRNALANLAKGTARRIVKPGQIFNRIHVDDISGALMHLAAAETGGVFNVTDDEPSPAQDVIVFAARLMGVPPPPEIPFEEAGLGPMARSFYGEVKRVSNARLKRAGYRFRHPDYCGALEAMWQDGNWREEA